MTSKLTSEILDDETLAELIAFRRSRVEYCQKEGLPYQKALHDSMMLALEELQERRKAERDSNPVGWTDEAELRDVEKDGCGYLFKANPITLHADPRRVILLYRHAQPASEREQVRREHAEWSQSTFGSVGPIGPLKHLSKEALEAAAEPGDLSEWADMQFLLWDAQRRAGITDEQITQAMIEKLAVNKQRSWPEPKDGEPRLHIKEQPAPVVPDNRAITQHFDTIALETAREIMCDVNRRHEFLGGEIQLLSRIQCRIDDACRAAMLNGGKS